MCTEGILKGNENGGFVSADETVRKMLPYRRMGRSLQSR